LTLVVSMLMKVMALALLALSVVDARHAYNKVTKSGELPVVGYLEERSHTNGLCDANVTQHSGYFKIDEVPSAFPGLVSFARQIVSVIIAIPR
jgi:hypothetical protein